MGILIFIWNSTLNIAKNLIEDLIFDMGIAILNNDLFLTKIITEGCVKIYPYITHLVFRSHTILKQQSLNLKFNIWFLP